jgi:hypothetical protein
MRIYPERYGDIYKTYINTNTPFATEFNRISNSTVFNVALPVDFIDIYECIFSWTLGKNYVKQGRKVIKQELYSIQSNSLMRGYVESPVYCEEVLVGSKNLYVTGFDIQNGTLLDKLTTPYIEVDVYYLKALDNLQKYVTGVTDVDTTIPETFQNIVTDIACLYALETTNQVKESIEVMIQSKMKDLGINYDIEKLKAEQLLPTKQPI